jgi:hypothetical protein
MSAIINFSLNLDKLDKGKVIKGAKGNYYNVTLSVNDEVSQYGHNASLFDTQTKEERTAKSERNYIGNGKVMWTDGNISAATAVTKKSSVSADDDLPF